MLSINNEGNEVRLSIDGEHSPELAVEDEEGHMSMPMYSKATHSLGYSPSFVPASKHNDVIRKTLRKRSLKSKFNSTVAQVKAFVRKIFKWCFPARMRTDFGYPPSKSPLQVCLIIDVTRLVSWHEQRTTAKLQSIND